MAIDKPDIKLGFNVAIGFFLFGLIIFIAQYLFTKAKTGL